MPFETAVGALAAGHALGATARSVHVDTETVGTWLPRVAWHGRPVMLYGWHELPGSDGPRAEWWRVVPTKAARRPGAKIDGETSGDAWGWSALAPVWRLGLACVIGTRDQAGAAVRLARVAQVTADARPLCTSEPGSADRHAVLHPSGAWDHPPRQGHRGADPKPRRRPPPGLRSAQVVKRRQGGRMVAVSTQVVVGTPAAVAASWAPSPVSGTGTTSVVERATLTPRPSHRRFTRRPSGVSKDLTWFAKQRWLSLAYDQVVVPHKRVRQRLPTPEPTRGAGAPRLWRPVTPAMAAGLTDHVWTTDEWLAYRVPVEFLDQRRTIEDLFPEWNGVHHSN